MQYLLSPHMATHTLKFSLIVNSNDKNPSTVKYVRIFLIHLYYIHILVDYFHDKRYRLWINEYKIEKAHELCNFDTRFALLFSLIL